MIKPDMTYVESLPEFYEEIKRLQAGAHSKEYIEHHKALKKCARDPDVKVIKELGVCQGGTLAAMMLEHPKILHGYDIATYYYNPYKNLFNDYAKEHNIDFKYIGMSSLDTNSVYECDLLHIDSLHEPDHLMQELRLHAPTVSKYIVLHDTANFKTSAGLFKVIAKYITEVEQSWKIVDHYIHRVGYTVIQREERMPEVYNNLK